MKNQSEVKASGAAAEGLGATGGGFETKQVALIFEESSRSRARLKSWAMISAGRISKAFRK
jgi:hypothetical protein